MSGAEDGPGNQTHSHTFLWFGTLLSATIIPYPAYRKCKITLRGPWQQVPPIPLSDISLMPCLAQSRMEQVPVWALSDKGDVLCRLGVSPQNPAVRNVQKRASKCQFKEKQDFSLTPACLISQGSSWLHVGTDQPFKSISIGGANQVWAIAKDGAVFYRGSVSPQNPAGQLKT